MKEKVLPLLKARLGVSTSVRDSLFNALIDGIVGDCKDTHGIILEPDNPAHIMLVLDWGTWKYNHPEDGTTPRSIQYRLKNLIIKKAGEASGTDLE